MAVIVQKLRKTVDTDIEKAIKYYSILSIVNGLQLTQKQVELLAFTSVRGTITTPSARNEFVRLFRTTLSYLENVKNQLKKRGWMIEVDRKYRVNPGVALDFSKDIILQINMLTKDAGENITQEVEVGDDHQNSHQNAAV
jgi:hypothetical protein